jgi:outer membrane protein OmpA-like peptidoglycan-associated protein
VDILKNDGSLKADISGHSDDAAESATGNLSDIRAKKIYDYLLSKGIAAARLQYAGFGSSRPVDKKLLSDDPRLNQQLQRRVEVRFSRE